jgi:hypothetical protein
MNHRRHSILLAILVPMFSAGLRRAATGETPAPTEPPKVEGKIEFVGPDTYLLLDAEGRPQPVLGMSYEEFVAAWKTLQNVEASAEPRFTIDELRISGNARDDHAELDVELTIQSRETGTLKVPLGMADAILLEPPRFQQLETVAPAAKKQTLVSYEPQSGGYVAWVDGAAGRRQRLILKILRPLVRDGNEVSLALNLPRALVSQLSLDVPTPVVDAAAPGGLLKKQSTDGGGTQLNVTGPSGDFRLSWTTPASERQELSTVLSATGAIAVTIDGHSIRSDAHLTVRSYGGSFDRFRVRLPPGAQLVQDRPAEPGTTAPEYRLLPDNASSPSGDESQIVTVELAQKQLGPVDVDLSTEQPLGLPTAQRAVQLAGFAVLGAVRQFGDVAISVADDWQLRWENGPYVRQVERTELPTMLRERQPSVAFQYDRQPWSMHAQLVMRPMVIHVTPLYRLELGPDEARLYVHLDYQVPGARAFDFRVQLAGWELTADPIESNGLVDRDRVMVSRDGVLELPLAQASSRRAEIDFSVRRSLDRSESTLKLPLPVPVADTVAVAQLAVDVDAAIELTPNMAASRALTPTPVTDQGTIRAAADGKQSFDFQADIPGAIFAAERSLRPRDSTAEVDTQITVDSQRLQATQVIAYNVRYQPLAELALELPDGWSIAGDQIALSTSTPGAETSLVPTHIEPGQRARIARAALPQPRLGQFQVRVTYQVGETTGALQFGKHLLSLPQPLAARVIAHRVAVTAVPSLAIALDTSANSTWQPRVDAETTSALSLMSTAPAEVLPLIVAAAPRQPQDTTVQRVWLQTWQAGGTIQDRAALKFRTTSTEVVIELPPLASARDVEALVDGELARVARRQEGRMTIELPRRDRSGESAPSHTLELRYRRPAPVGLLTRHTLTPPQLVGTSTLSEVYWQIVLPGDRHIIQTPAQLNPVDPRQWLEVFWGRAASRPQSDFETWAGASHQLGPATNQNAYLFSGLSPASSIELLTAPRWLIVLVASSAVLAIASLWMYVPLARRGWISILMAAIVAGLAIAYPEAAVLVGQASALGVVFAAVGLALRHWTSSRAVPRPPATTGSTNMKMRSSLRTDSYLAPSLASSTSGTPTAPLVVLPEADR